MCLVCLVCALFVMDSCTLRDTLSRTVAHCGVHTLFVMDCCTLWGIYLVCHGLLHIVGYIPCLSWTVAHCGVHTLFVMDCCTLWGTYLVCHGLLHIVGYIPCLSWTVAHCRVCLSLTVAHCRVQTHTAFVQHGQPHAKLYALCPCCHHQQARGRGK